MEFPIDFFLDEVREGFFIPAMMKRAWAAELEILVEIDKICEKHKLRYFIDYGNLLGAIRHKGFIPWDDDIDIMMLRKDYEIFAKVANDELPKELLFRSPEDDSGNYELFSSVQHREMLISTDAIGKYHNYLYGAGVDIFPYDYLAKDPDKETAGGNFKILVYSGFFPFYRRRESSGFARRSEEGTASLWYRPFPFIGLS